MKKRTLSLLLAVVCLFSLTAGMLSGCRNSKVQVSFDLNYDGAPAAPAAIQVKTGKAYGELPAVTVQREGYTFAGWCLDADGEEPITAETTVTKETDHTLYAKWEGLEYTVSFDLQGGNINGVTTVEPATVKAGNVYSMMAIPDNPQKDNHTFLGWYYDAEGTQGPVTASTKVVKTCDHTLYAKWKENQLLYDFEKIEDISAFNNRGNGLSFTVAAYGDSNQLMIQNPNEGKSDNFLVMWAELKAGTRVTMDVTFTGELTEDARMHLFCYGANIVGDPITTGVINKALSDTHRKWYDGNGCRAKEENGTWFYGDENDWQKGNTVTIDFVVMEDCSGLSLWVNLGSNMEPAQWAQNAIYIDNIQFTPGYQEVTDADKGGVEQKPQEETEGEENFPFTFKCGSVDSDVFKLRDSNLNMSVVEKGGSQQLKLQLSVANGKNWLWLNKPLKAGTKITFDVTFDNGGTGAAMSIYGYGSKENGDPITVKPAGSNIPVQWYNGQGVSGSSGRKTVEVNIYENCYGVSLMLGFDGDPDTVIYLDNIKLGKMSADTQENTTGETDFPFTFECGGVSSDVFKLRDSDIKIVVESYENSQQLKIQPAKSNGKYWLWMNKDLKAGSKVTMDVTFTAENMSIFGYGSKETGDPITEGSPTDSIPQSWYWGQGGNASQTYTFTIYEDCHGLSLMLGFGSGTENAIYIDNIKLVQPGEEVPGETEPEENAGNNVGVLSAHSAGVNVDSTTGTIKGIYAVGAATNAVYGEDWSVEYAPMASQNLRLIRDGEIHNVGVPNVGTLIMISPVDYYLKIENQVFNGNWLPLCKGDLLVFEGQFFCKKDESSVINITRTYIKIGDDAVEFSATGPVVPEVPVIDPSDPIPEQPGVETESPFTFDDGKFSADIFNNRNNGLQVSVENQQLKLQQPAGAANWLWFKQSFTAGTTVTMDVTFSGDGMSIFGYGSKANGDPITEGTPTDTIPQSWYWGQGGSESGTYTFTIYEDCDGLSLMLGFGGSTESIIYIDNVVITLPGEQEPTEPEPTDPETTEPTDPGAETESPFTFDNGTFSADIFNNRNNGLQVSVENQQLKLQQPAGAANWLWFKQSFTAGTTVTMDVTFSGDGMSIFGYGSKANGDPITEGTPTDTIPQSWYWGQGGSESGTYTFTIYEDCDGLSLMLGFGGSTESIIYIDNVVITLPGEQEPTEPEGTTPDATEPAEEEKFPFTFEDGIVSENVFKLRDSDLEMTVAEQDGSQQLKLQPTVSNGKHWLWLNKELKAGTVITMDVTFQRKLGTMSLYLYGAKESGDPITEGTPTDTIPQSWFWGQGVDADFTSGNTNTQTVTFTVYEDCYGISFMLGYGSKKLNVIFLDNIQIVEQGGGETTEPDVTKPEETVPVAAETESPFTFEGGSFSADIFDKRSSELDMSVVDYDGSKQLKISYISTSKWLWLHKELNAGTTVSFDVTFDNAGTGESMSIFCYGSKANGDPISEGTPTDTIPQSWFWGQGVSAEFDSDRKKKYTVTFTVYEYCSGMSMMMGFGDANKTSTAIYLDNIVITEA